MSQHHIALSDRNANGICLSNSNQSAALSSQLQSEALVGQIFPEPTLLQRGGRGSGGPPPSRASLHLFHTHLATGSPSPACRLILVLAELSGSAATSLSNFPHPSRTPFLLRTVVKRQKAGGLAVLFAPL